MDTIVSKHGTKRIRQRCGIPKKATSRLTERAFQEGKDRTSVHGRLRRWIDNTVDLDDGKFVRLYRGKVYVFGERNVFITILNVPGNLQKQLNMQTKTPN